MKLRHAALMLFALCSASAANAQSDEPERLRIHGSNAMGEHLVPALVVGWLRSMEFGDIKRREVSRWRTEIGATRDGEKLIVEIEKRGTASGFAALVSADAEIAMTARSPTAKEIDDAWQLGDLRSPDQEWVAGLDGLTVVVAPGNPASVLSIAQLRDVLSGKTRDWRELGGNPGKIELQLMDASSGTQELTRQLVLAGASTTASAKRHSRPADIVSAVAAGTNAIGIIGLRTPRTGVKVLGIRSGTQVFSPDMLAVRSEAYPLARRLHFHSGQMITAFGRGFLLYVISPAGQALVDRSRFVSFSLAPMDVPVAQLPSDYRKMVGNAKRLPITLRFSTGLDLFDSRSRQDLNRLSAYLARPENAQRKVVLVGFSNPEPKNPYQALSFSQERVDYVASELLALDMKVVTVRGLGGRMPLADGAGPAARFRNNRIEVWLR